MTVTVEQVRLWAMDRGKIGHVIYSAHDATWSVTICGTFSNMRRQTETPKRICAKCRAELKKATLLEPSDGERTG